MSSSVFHPFARLPVELRLQIWEAACVISTPSHRYLQYVAARDGEVVPLPCNWNQPGERIPLEKKNRSAYLIDGGLWKACKDSREVIAQYSHFYDWIRIQKQALYDGDRFSECLADWSGGHEFTHPAIIDTCQGEVTCRMLIYPSRDIFCIHVEDWIALHRDAGTYDLGLQTSFIRYDKAYYHELLPNNIALEFDPSWLMDILSFKYIYKLGNENSARGYLSHLLSRNHWTEIDVEGIWIIDKEAKWFTSLPKHHDTVYQDCDAEYVEVKWADVVNYTGNGSSATASKFIEKLDCLCMQYCLPSDTDFDHLLGRGGPIPQNVIRLLVRRDNEVKDPTIGRSFTRDEFGWVIYSDEDEDEDEG
ncbi:hypothetical protein FPOAC2_12523 [Fusarium poae]|jgi:hypothetical protein|uniref:hypothetical protein n=1 Tax=Fusarium poae TaxID=36050 RepID=UPI001CE9C8BA|nr:hypothetical protein FPOAC1_012187 [Fusarium poae]KAG8667359.1 hypothetical protein FPOAC1_012187 [Fusarium poae]